MNYAQVALLGDSINSDAIYHSVVRDKLPPLPSKGSELLIIYFEMTENYRIMVSRDLEAGTSFPLSRIYFSKTRIKASIFRRF